MEREELPRTCDQRHAGELRVARQIWYSPPNWLVSKLGSLPYSLPFRLVIEFLFPNLPERSRCYGRGIAVCRPGGGRRSCFSQNARDPADLTVANQSFLHKAHHAVAERIKSRVPPSKAICRKRETFRELCCDPVLRSGPVCFTIDDLSTLMQQELGNVDLDRANLAACSAQARSVWKLLRFVETG